MIKKIHKNLYGLGLLFGIIFSAFAFTLNAQDNKVQKEPKEPLFEENLYTINFTDVSIIEFIKFVSKITKENFIFNEDELNFNVTIVSNEPTNIESIMSALLQVLRIHGLSLLEQDNNLLIHKNPEVKQIPTVVSDEFPMEEGFPPAIITRVFRIKNADATQLAGIITPMLSSEALVEVMARSNHLIVSDIIGNIEQISHLLVSLDVPSPTMDVDAFHAKHSNVETLVNLATQIITPLAEGSPVILVPQKSTASIFIVSTPYLIERTIAILADLDNMPASEKVIFPEDILIYKLQYKSESAVGTALKEITQGLTEQGFASQGLIETINEMKYIAQTHSLLFTGDPDDLKKIGDFLKAIDVPISEEGGLSTSFYVYKIQSSPEEQIQQAINDLIDNLTDANYPDKELIQALQSLKWIQDTNSLIFTGTDQALSKIKELLPEFDIPPEKSQTLASEFYMYLPKNRSGLVLLTAVKETSKNLVASNLVDPVFLQTLQNVKFIESVDALLFTGPKQSIDRVKTLMPVIDQKEVGKDTLFVYQVKYVSSERIKRGLNDIAASLPQLDPLKETIESMKWLPDSNSFSFIGTANSLNRIKDILATIDTPTVAKTAASEQKTYYLYKIKNVKGQVIIDDFEKMANKLEDSGIPNTDLIKSLRSAEWIKSTNSIYVSGTPEVIEQIKALLTEFDIGRAPEGHVEQATNFFVYKPKHASPEEIKNSLLMIGEDLEQAGLSDPSFLNTITNMRYVKATNSLIFTGTQKSIAQIQDLLASVDISEAKPQIQELGATTFFIYRVKYVPAQELMSSLQTMVEDFSKVGSTDKALEKTINNMRYVKATNSIVFVGPKSVLNRIQELVAKFDIPALAEQPVERAAEGYILYKPKHQSGEELIQLLKDFEQNLIRSGLKEEALFDAINNMKWMPKTSQILVSGTESAIQKVEELLDRFDIAGTEKEKEKISKEPAIETIEDVSFLIYKLQYHKGGEIEGALQKIASDIKEGTPEKNKKLLEAINSVQWIDVTNSLIATGDAKTLAKLKELIQNIDVPLRQVFIEVLVLETSLNNSLDFGLRWGSQGKYRDKFGYGFINTPQTPTGGSDPFADFNTNFSNINATRVPTGSDIPLDAGGFDLGIIGDIILHKGKSYFALGSLVNALQIDGDTNIVLNQKIITQDGRLSTLFVGDNIPFTGSVISITGAASSTQQSIEYRDIGVTLSITPTLGESEIITLDIDEEITEATNIPTSGQEVAQGIQTSKRSMQTRVHIPDKTFLVLSGQIRNQVTRQRQGLPCLGGLPLVGAAFSETQRNREATNVIIFVKPHIIDTWSQYKKLTEQQEDLYRDQLRPSGPDAVEDFDQGLELVKTPDDN
ncbi:MAG: hypothetical protein Tsb0015_02690 [Simkaniaceae bacterium]